MPVQDFVGDLSRKDRYGSWLYKVISESGVFLNDNTYNAGGEQFYYAIGNFVRILFDGYLDDLLSGNLPFQVSFDMMVSRPYDSFVARENRAELAKLIKPPFKFNKLKLSSVKVADDLRYSHSGNSFYSISSKQEMLVDPEMLTSHVYMKGVFQKLADISESIESSLSHFVARDTATGKMLTYELVEYSID